MPCTVSKEEEEWYEKEGNKKLYGVADLDDRITERVACELAKVLEQNNMLYLLTPVALKWIEKHKKEDKRRAKKK